jgi:pimeloyl-ACP methyl ester carboxylesterase
MYLRLIFNFSVNDQDSLKASMESPDQGSGIIPLGTVKLDGDKIEVAAPVIGGKYTGTITGEKKIEGNWEQMGRVFPLVLEKQDSPFKLNRPQEPKPPFPYQSEEVTFRNEGGAFNLAGTLTIPEGNGPFPAAILITGSGAQNRDEELMGHKPFAVIADHLTRNGIAVLRYDDRGVGKSQGDYSKATSADLATDAEAAFRYLATRKEIAIGKTGFIGHSEGGLIAPIAVALEPSVGWLVSLAGPGVPGDMLLHKQNEEISRAMGGTEEEISSAIKINKKLFGILKKTDDNSIAEEKIIKTYTKELNKMKVPAEILNERVNNLKLTFGASSYTWFRFFIKADPTEYWSKIKSPVLILNGEKDLQVNSAINTAGIAAALNKGGNNLHKTVTFPGLNHLFQSCETGLPGEYGTIEETISPEVLNAMTLWIREVTLK